MSVLPHQQRRCSYNAIKRSVRIQVCPVYQMTSKWLWPKPRLTPRFTAQGAVGAVWPPAGVGASGLPGYTGRLGEMGHLRRLGGRWSALGGARRPRPAPAAAHQPCRSPGARVTSFQAFLESRAFGYFGLGWSAPRHIQWPCVVQGGAGVPRQQHQTPGGSQKAPGAVQGARVGSSDGARAPVFEGRVESRVRRVIRVLPA
mgnify:CR=1 FL=1